MTSSDNVAKAVFKAMSDTFEGMAFVQISRQEDQTPVTDSPDLIWSRVDVEAPAKGFLVVAYTREMGVHIVESLYGIMDEPCTKEVLEDSLNEIVNTVIGRCMSLLVPEGQTFELGLPQTGEGWPEMETATTYGFSTMDGGLLLAAADLKDLDLNEEPLVVEGYSDEPSSSDDDWGSSDTQDDGWG
ncbi:MAG: chemotaxis protein CheX [Desulfatibacillum sp.]|nr:chemotaxis protein CheX [Desulfatibacillum sp.]